MTPRTMHTNTANDAFRRPRHFDATESGKYEAGKLAAKLSSMKRDEFAVVYTAAHGKENYRVMIYQEIRAFKRNVRSAVTRVCAVAFGGRLEG